MDTAQSGLTFRVLADARAYARTHALRERAVCHITRRRGEETQLLVFEHVPDGDSGVQVLAGGLEPGETPQGAALREAGEETGCGGWRVTGDLGSAAWLNPEHAKRELRHFFHLAAPDDLPDTDLPDPGSTTPTTRPPLPVPLGSARLSPHRLGAGRVFAERSARNDR